MSMKPILFNTDMVRAIMAGRKTVTRRVVRPQHLRVLDSPYHQEHPDTPDEVLLEKLCQPPYRPGDILYVRETWRNQPLKWSRESRYSNFELQYRADFTDEENDCYGRCGGVAPWKWHPSIHMPKEAARIFLRVTEVRVERLQTMSCEDVVCEGINPRWEKPWLTEDKHRLHKFGTDTLGRPYCCAFHVEGCLDTRCANRDTYKEMCHIEPFAGLWDSTIKPADRALYGWAANPWVWVIEFERCEKSEVSP